MDIDIGKIARELLEKITKDEALQKEFLENPVGTLEKKLGVDLPDEKINAVIDAIKAKLNLGKIGSVVDSVENVIGGLFKKE